MRATQFTLIALIALLPMPAFAAPTPSISMTATLERPMCPEGQPVVLAVALHNDSAQKWDIGGDAFEASSFQITVTDSAGRAVPRTALGDRIQTPPAATTHVEWDIEPGQTFRYHFNLAHLFDLSRTGVYAVTISRRLRSEDANPKAGSLPSPEIMLAAGPVKVRMVDDGTARSGPTVLTPPPNHQTFLYAANADYFMRSFVSRYRVAEDGGVSFAFSPPPLALAALAGEGIDSLAAAPNGHFLYAANGGDNTVSQFRIGADGELSPLTPPTVPARKFPGFLLMDPKGRFLYALSGYGNTLYAIGPDGRLTVKSMVTTKAWVQDQDHDVVPAGFGAIDSSGTFLYACADFRDVSGPGPYDCDGMTVGYRLAPDGGVTALTPATKYRAGRRGFAPFPPETGQLIQRDKAIVFSTAGRFAFVLASKPMVKLYGDAPDYIVVPMRVGADGSLLPLPEVPTPPVLQPISGFPWNPTLVVDPSGRFLLVRVNPGDPRSYGSGIARFRIGPEGSLTPLGVTPHDGLVVGIAFGPVGHLMYVLSRAPGSLTAFRLDDQGGLTPAGLDKPEYEVPYSAVGPASVVAPTPQKWGPPVGGLQISARMAADVLSADAPVVLTVTLKNSTSHPLRLGTAGTDLSSFRLSLIGPQRQAPDIRSPNAPLQPYQVGPDGLPGSGDPAVAAVPLTAVGKDILGVPSPSVSPLVLPPGRQRQYRLVLSHLADLTLVGNYTVHATRALPNGQTAVSPVVYFRLDGPYDHLLRGGPERHLEIH